MKLISLLFILLLLSCSPHKNESTPVSVTTTYQRLDTVLESRKESVQNYLTAVQKQASLASTDSVLQSTFITHSKGFSLTRSEEMALVSHHILHYSLFYDILFVDTSGFIFNTIMRENDYRENINEGSLANSSLAQKLRQNSGVKFVDFQNYRASYEPAAFFVEPIRHNDTLLGWCVFQLSINKLNTLFHTVEQLGRTGEVILVNEDRYMLSDSRFGVHSTILKQKLISENIKSKFLMGKGHKEVIDYRGKAAFTSFTTFSLMDTRWLLIAKIDRQEVMTSLYDQNRPHYDIHFLHTTPLVAMEDSPLSADLPSVHMDAYKRTDSAGTLYTKSIATCTAIHISLPHEFAYLTHISPSDKIYGEESTDMLGYLLKEISEKEIVRSRMNELRFTIVSPNADGIIGAVHTIVDAGYFLPQISIAHRPTALFADLYSSLEKDTLIAQWYFPHDMTTPLSENLQSIPPLEIEL